jgi:hypothetical protein
MRRILLLFLLLIPTIGFAEKLFIIEHVSDTQSVFVINHGITDGIIYGQKSLFTTDHFSMVAIATKVTRFYSMWRPIDADYKIPFHAGETVRYNSNRDGIFKEIPQLVSEYQRIEEYKRKIKAKRRAFREYTLRFTTISGLAESSSTIAVIDNFSRIGAHLNLTYNQKMSESFAFNYGVRYDVENLKLTGSPTLTIPVNRYIGTFGFTYFFNGSNPESNYYFYLTASVGYGKASSTVSGIKSSGTSIVLPTVAMGIELKLSDEYSFLLEAGMENITTNDTYTTGDVQTNRQSTAIVSAGLTF